MLIKQLRNENKLMQGPARTEHSHCRGKTPIGAARPWEGEGNRRAEGDRGQVRGDFNAREDCSG